MPAGGVAAAWLCLVETLMIGGVRGEVRGADGRRAAAALSKHEAWSLQPGMLAGGRGVGLPRTANTGKITTGHQPRLSSPSAQRTPRGLGCTSTGCCSVLNGLHDTPAAVVVVA